MSNNEFITGTMLPWYQRRWWLRTRYHQTSVTTEGIYPSGELYVPWWATPLEFVHRAFVGKSQLKD